MKKLVHDITIPAGFVAEILYTEDGKWKEAPVIIEAGRMKVIMGKKKN